MPEKPMMHGRDHRPGGLDPSFPGDRHDFVTNDEAYTAWDSGTTYAAGDQVSVTNADGSGFNFVAIGPSTNVNPGDTLGNGWDAPARRAWQYVSSIMTEYWQYASEVTDPTGFRLVVGPSSLDPATGDFNYRHLHLYGTIQRKSNTIDPTNPSTNNLVLSYIPPDFQIPQANAMAWVRVVGDTTNGPFASLNIQNGANVPSNNLALEVVVEALDFSTGNLNGEVISPGLVRISHVFG